MYIGDTLGRRAIYTPDRLAVVDTGKPDRPHYTYAQMNERANRFLLAVDKHIHLPVERARAVHSRTFSLRAASPCAKPRLASICSRSCANFFFTNDALSFCANTTAPSPYSLTTHALRQLLKECGSNARL